MTSALSSPAPTHMKRLGRVMAGNLKCRNMDYLGGKAARFPVPDEKIPWSVNWPEYKPVDYTAPSVQKGPVWADPDFR